MRIEIRPRIRVKNDGRIQVIVWRNYFESGINGEVLHHREALARGNYWIVVRQEFAVPEVAIFEVGDLAVEQPTQILPCNIFPGGAVWDALMGKDK